MASTFQSLLHASSSSLPRKCITTSTIWLISDSIAQHGVESKPLQTHDWKRSARQTIYSGLVLAPMMNAWLGNVIQRIVLRGKVSTLIARVGIDQIVMGPCSISIFFTYSNFTTGGDLDTLKRKFRETWLDTYKAAIFLWVPSQAINFALVPPNLRLLFLNCTSLVWSTYLSFTNARHIRTQEELARKELMAVPR